MTTNPLRDQIEALFGYCKGGPDGGWSLAKGDLISRKEVLALAAIQPDPEPQPVAWGGKRTANVFHRSDNSVAVEMSIGCQTIEYWAFEYDRRKLSSFLSARKAAEAAQRAFLIDLPPRTTPSSAGMMSVEAAAKVISAYDRDYPMRTADQHRDGCDCLRCSVDALRALAGERG